MLDAPKHDKNNEAYKNGKAYKRKAEKRKRIRIVIIANVAVFVIAMLIALFNCILSFPLYTEENTEITEGVCKTVTFEEVGYRGATNMLITLDTGEVFSMDSEVRKHYFDSSFLEVYQNDPVTIRHSKNPTFEPRTIVALEDSQSCYLDFEDSKQNQIIQWIIIFVICFFVYCAFGVVSFINLSTYLTSHKKMLIK